MKVLIGGERMKKSEYKEQVILALLRGGYPYGSVNRAANKVIEDMELDGHIFDGE